MANKDMFLWWGSGSPPCWKAMLALAEKGLWEELPNELISFSDKGHKKEAVLKVNPRGQMPTFKDGNNIVNESSAICMYLEEKFKSQGTQLLPDDFAIRAQIYQYMFEIDNIRSNIMMPIVVYKMMTKKEVWDNDMLKEKIEPARKEIDTWNNYLKGKTYLCGDKFTMADVFFFPFLAFLVRMGLQLTSRPDLKKYYTSLCQRPSVQATWPPHYKESEGKDWLAEL
ncbi:hypothetical protein ACF0H5_013918 [Mactra antiquata]